jgi:cell division transport system permease protein
VRPSLVLSEVGIGLRRNLTMTIATIVTISLSLTLVGTALLVRNEVTAAKGYWYDKVEVAVYLCGSTSASPGCHQRPLTDEERRAVGDQLRALPQVAQVYYESQQDAYGRFKREFAGSPDLVNNVSPDALPESYRVKLKDPTQFEVIATALRDQPGVDQVQDMKEFLRPFFDVLNKIQQIALGLAVAAVVAAVLLVSNSVRVAAFSRRRETGIMRLVGASSMSIQLPFIVEGLIAGLIGAAVASAAVIALKVFAIDGLRGTFRLTRMIGWPDVLAVLPWLFAIGVVLAGMSSFLTLRRHLRV